MLHPVIQLNACRAHKQPVVPPNSPVAVDEITNGIWDVSNAHDTLAKHHDTGSGTGLEYKKTVFNEKGSPPSFPQPLSSPIRSSHSIQSRTKPSKVLAPPTKQHKDIWSFPQNKSSKFLSIPSSPPKKDFFDLHSVNDKMDIRDLEKQLQEKEKQHDYLKLSFNGLKEHNDELLERIEKLEKQRDQLRREIAAVKANTANVVIAKNRWHHDQLTDLQAQVREQAAGIRELENSIKVMDFKHGVEKTTLNNQIEELEKKLKASESRALELMK